ncbi:secreted phosphoprotein 24, partial [Trichechus inunguis]
CLFLAWAHGLAQVRNSTRGPPPFNGHRTFLATCLRLTVAPWAFCPGFPVYDYDPSSLKEALSASVAKVNSQALSPYLFRAFRSSIKRVNVVDEDSLNMDLEFSIRETVCRRDSGENPTTCDFQRGYFVPVVVCRSSVKLSAQQVRDVWVQCHWSSSSESNSREEVGPRA